MPLEQKCKLASKCITFVVLCPPNIPMLPAPLALPSLKKLVWAAAGITIQTFVRAVTKSCFKWRL